MHSVKKKELTRCVSPSRSVNQIDTDLSEMSVHLLGIHVVPPPDSMLSDCQTSLKGESHQHILHHTLAVYMIAIRPS